MKGKLNNKRKGRAEKGITLVALVVTIVVLLILAGVSIVTLFGESGIITAAQKAANETNKGVTEETTGIGNLEKDMNTALGIVPETTKGSMVDKGTKFAKYTDSTSSAPAYIPGGYGVVQDSTTDTDATRKINSISNGLVISDLAEDTLDNEPINGVRGNQFVWVPVPDINSMYGTTEDGKQYGKLYDYGTYNSSTSKWTAFASPTPKAYPTTKNSDYREPDVVTDASKGSDSWTGSKYDAVEANLNIITDFKVANGQTKTAELFKEYLQDEFDNMIASVKKYKGFYIGRYETGNLSKANSSTVKAVVQKGNSNLASASWYAQYQEIKNMTAENNNVTSSIIWGCQWDRTLNWFKETGTTMAELVDSTSWGNHSDNTETGHGSKQTSGYKITWQKNHIYDMAGNVYDWTMEACNAGIRVIRGGGYNFSGSRNPACRRNDLSPTSNDGYTRFSFHTLRKSVTWFN